MPPKRVIEIEVDVPEQSTEDVDASTVRVVELQRDGAPPPVTHVTFYATAMAALLELHDHRRATENAAPNVRPVTAEEATAPSGKRA